MKKRKYKVKNIRYIGFTILFILILDLGFIFEQNIETIKISEIFKNIAYSSISSIIVAYALDVVNTRDKNDKLEQLYESTYAELKASIILYLQSWSEFCYVTDKSKDYKSIKNTWIEWYNQTKQILLLSDKSKKKEMQKFLRENLLLYSLDNVNNAIQKILNQKNLLEINDIYDEKLGSIINNFAFEFNCARKELDYSKNIDDLFKSFDALNSDFARYINSWDDLKPYNKMKFKPYNIDDASEYIKAVFKTKFSVK